MNMTKLNRNVLRKVARDALPELFEELGFSEKINNELQSNNRRGY